MKIITTDSAWYGLSEDLNPPCNLTWMNIEKIKPHEEHDTERAEAIAANIKKTGIALLISVTEQGVLLDGHHRFHALKSLGYNRIPVMMFDYSNNAISNGTDIPKEEVQNAALLGNLYPPKTTKHILTIQGKALPLIYFSQHFII